MSTPPHSPYTPAAATTAAAQQPRAALPAATATVAPPARSAAATAALATAGLGTPSDLAVGEGPTSPISGPYPMPPSLLNDAAILLRAHTTATWADVTAPAPPTASSALVTAIATIQAAVEASLDRERAATLAL